MKPVLIVFYLFVFSFHAFSQKDPPILSAELARAGDDMLDSGDYKKALSFFDQIDRNDSNYVRSLYGRALSCQGDSQFNKAIQYCRELLQLKDPTDLQPNIYSTYASLLDQTGEIEKSLAVYDEAIRIYPSFSKLYFNKGITLYDQKRYAEAESVFKETLMINPYQYSAHYFLGLSAVRQGKVVPAFLSFVGYLLVNPGGKYEKQCVNILASMANGRDEILDYKNNRTGDGDENFSLTEDILLSKIALEKQYKLAVSLDDPIFRQIQVVCEKLEYKADDPDFWMQYYVPFYKKLFGDNQFEPFIYWSFENVQIKEIQDYNKKNKKLVEHFVGETARYFDQIRSTRILTYTKRAEQKIIYLYTNNVLAGRGEMSGDGQNLNGAWTILFPPGNVKATGLFKDSKKYGEWIHYYFSGKLKAKENYQNDKSEGRQIYYSEQGLMTNDLFFQNDQKNGVQTEFFVNGLPSYITGYSSGKKEGDYKIFFPGGQLKAKAQYMNDLLSGPFANYYENGQISNTGTYQSGSLDGAYKEFYENGGLSAEGLYKNNLMDGAWKYYYSNGKLKSQTPYVNGKQEGIEEEYYEDGPLSDTYTYKKGILNGEAVSYDKDQKIYARFQFSSNALESAQYFDKAGKQFSSAERKNKQLDLTIFQPDGTRTTQRSLNERGQINGKETNYYTTGAVSRIIEYKDGVKNGQYTEYYQNGRKKADLVMKDGKQEGNIVNYYPNGKIQAEGWMKEGQAVGYWNYYDDSGNQTDRDYFVDGLINGYKTEYYANGKVSFEKKFFKGLLEELKQFDSTGKLLVYDSFPQFNGKFIIVYPDGHKMQEFNYIKGNIEGPLTQYYFDGSIGYSQYYKGGFLDSNYIQYDYHHIKTTEGQYKAGKKTGLWKYYTKDGKLETTENYADGELNGTREIFGDDNKITGEINYRHDKRNGQAINKDPDGSLMYTTTYEDGKVKEYSFLDKEGKPVSAIQSLHGQLSMKSFFQNGQPSRDCAFTDNLLNGKDRLFYSNGKLRSEDNFKYGIYEGQSAEYYPNGNPRRIYQYKNDHPQGRCLEYNEQGKLIRELNYYNGNLHGKSKYYSDNGTLLETRYYYHGYLLSVKK
jgi:antitoxin component YwqK of YwqJK toxin-antitoxin module/Tfp pilus assembly protein PilF